MVVLIGGLRVLGANHGERGHGHFTKRSGQLTNDFFVNLLDMTNVWKAVDGSGDEEYVATDRAERRREMARDPRRPDLRLELPSCARSPRSMPRRATRRSSCRDFVKAWTKVMNADRFDLRQDARKRSRSVSRSRRWQVTARRLRPAAAPFAHWRASARDRWRSAAARGEHLEFGLARAGRRQISAMRRWGVRASGLASTPCSGENPGFDRHFRDEGQAKAVVDHLHQACAARCPSSPHARAIRAGCRRTARDLSGNGRPRAAAAGSRRFRRRRSCGRVGASPCG